MGKRNGTAPSNRGKNRRHRSLLWLLSCGFAGCTLQAANDGPTRLAAPQVGTEVQVSADCTVIPSPTGYRVDCATTATPVATPTVGTTTPVDTRSPGLGGDGESGSDAQTTALAGAPALPDAPVSIGEVWSHSGTDVALPPEPLATDPCDEASFADASWERLPGRHISLNALAGTVAWDSADGLRSRYESIYDKLRDALNVEEDPLVEIFLSPNRVAARQHGKRYGIAYPQSGVIEALYVGSPDEYEHLHPGYLLTRLLAPKILGPNEYLLPVLARGLGELMDQSERDLHLAYAYELVTANEKQGSVAHLGALDLEGQLPGSAGSLVQHLVEAFGMSQFRRIMLASAVTWQSNGYTHPDVGPLETGQDIEQVLDQAIALVASTTWDATRAEWQDKVLEALSEPLPEVSEPDRVELGNLVAVADLALNSDAPTLYRSTMEGFYCVGWTDQERLATASNMVASYGLVTTRILRIYPVSTRHFRSARILAVRDFGDGNTTTTFYDAEKFPVGWRFTWAPEW